MADTDPGVGTAYRMDAADRSRPSLHPVKRIWYLVEQGERQGPLSVDAMRVLRALGRLNDDTYVWRSGLGNWQRAAVERTLTEPWSRPAGGGIFLLAGGRQLGPMAETTFDELVETGVLPRDTIIWTSGLREWISLEHFEALPASSRQAAVAAGARAPHGRSRDASVQAPQGAARQRPEGRPRTASEGAEGADALGFRPDPPGDRRMAVRMQRASLWVLLVLVGLGFYSFVASIATPEPLPEKWPDAFDESPPAGLDRAQGITSEAAAADAARAYGFVTGQRMMTDRIVRRHARLAARARTAAARFDRAYGPAFDEIDTLFSGWNDDDWGETKSLIASELQKQLPHSAALSYRDAVLFVDELEHRADGELPEEIKKTLLTFHPRYRQSPHLEMVDGFTLEYRSAGAQKAKGVDFGIEYPASWEAKEGRRPNIVQVFTSDQGRGLTTANVLVKRKPDELTGSAFTEISRQDLVDIFAGTMDHVVLHDAGTADVAGSPSVWGEVESEMQNAGIPVTLHGLVFMIEKGDHLVVVNLFGGSSSAADAPSASELFAQHAQTFHLMMVSFEFYDRFE